MNSTFLKIETAITLFFLSLLTVPTASAFPPAPYHTLYGMVRDEQGQTLRVNNAQIVFYRNGTELFRHPITADEHIDRNYRIRLRMDMERTDTEVYNHLANNTGTAFSLGIIINSVVYHPIEMSVSREVGKPGERVRLDLTLGVDSDSDGLPDAWEQSQLYAAGILPDGNEWPLHLIDRDGDFDHDGFSNWNEYLAGTYATDPTDYLYLEIQENTESTVILRFFSIYGKVYSLQSSTDLENWSPIPFYLTNPDTGTIALPEPYDALKADATDFAEIFADTSADDAPTFYRLKVR